MTRVKKGTQRNKKRKRLLKQAKGYRWGRKSKKRKAKQALLKAGQYAFRDRKVKKRRMRRRWQNIINHAVRAHDMNYSTFIHKLKEADVKLDRKTLANLIQHHPDTFERVVEHVK
jgi:large subunit ribosomal protein L20